MDENEISTSESNLESFKYSANYLHKAFDGTNDKTYLSSVFSGIFALTIILGFIVSFMVTMPLFTYTPASCDNPVCDNDPILCPGTKICEPIPWSTFNIISDACIYIFTIEYMVKLSTHWAVSASDLDIVLPDWNPSHNDIAPKYPWYEHSLRYILAFKNIVDLVTILPYYIQIEKASKSFNVFLRVFKLIRILKLMNRFAGVQMMFNLVIQTMRRSVEALTVMAVFLVLVMIFYGSIIYELESGTFEVTPDYPSGAYLRHPISQTGWEISPYVSIPTSMYWVITTCTTVGYGDLVPMTWSGRMIACVVMITGLLVLALPIGVIGSNFTTLYAEVFEERYRQVRQALHLNGMSDDELSELFESIDTDGSGLIDVFEMKACFDSRGLHSIEPTVLHKIFTEADPDGDGFLNMNEFLAMCKHMETVPADVINCGTATKRERQKKLTTSKKILPQDSPVEVAPTECLAPPNMGNILKTSSSTEEDGIEQATWVVVGEPDVAGAGVSAGALNEPFLACSSRHDRDGNDDGVSLLGNSQIDFLIARVKKAQTELTRASRRHIDAESELRAAVQDLVNFNVTMLSAVSLMGHVDTVVQRGIGEEDKGRARDSEGKTEK